MTRWSLFLQTLSLLTPLPGTLLVWGPRAARLAVLNEAEAGAKTGELCRRHGMSEATFYKWKAKYAGLTLNELKRLRSLEDENRRLKQIVAQQALDNWSLKPKSTEGMTMQQRNGR